MRAFGVAGLVGIAWFTAALLLMHGVAGSALDWTRHYVSEFANAPSGWILAVGILGHAGGNVALAFGLHRALQGGSLRSWASGMFVLAAGGLALTGLFAVDPPAAPASAAAALHPVAASAAIVVELAAVALFSVAFRRETLWRGAAPVSAVLSALAALASAMLIIAIVIGWRQGLAERVALAVFLAWEAWAAWRLASGRVEPIRRTF